MAIGKQKKKAMAIITIEDSLNCLDSRVMSRP